MSNFLTIDFHCHDIILSYFWYTRYTDQRPSILIIILRKTTDTYFFNLTFPLVAISNRLARFMGCFTHANPAGIYLIKVNNRNTRNRCEICSKLTIKTPERRQWRRSGVFIVSFKHISHLVLMFLLLTLNR